MTDAFTKLLSEYLDNELSPGERARVEAHLQTCAGCQGSLADLRVVVGRAKSLSVDVPLEGRVYNFSKLKDHAVLEVTVTKTLDSRQRGALWFLVTGTALLIICEFIRRLWQRRTKVVKHVAAAAV